MDLPAPIDQNTGIYPVGERPPCPFYGLAFDQNLFLDSKGNRCALIYPDFFPCKMKKGGETPNWYECTYNTEERRREIIEEGWINMQVSPRELKDTGRRINLLDWARHVMNGEEL